MAALNDACSRIQGQRLPRPISNTEPQEVSIRTLMLAESIIFEFEANRLGASYTAERQRKRSRARASAGRHLVGAPCVAIAQLQERPRAPIIGLSLV